MSLDPKNKGMMILIVVAIASAGGIGGYALGNGKFLNPNGNGGFGNSNCPVCSMTNFTDSRNRLVEVPWHPLRIVSMAPSITEIIFAIGAQDRLVGVTDFCNYPAKASSKTSIGGFSTPDLEVLASLNPDLIIAATWEEDSAKILTDAGYTLVIIDNNTLTGIINGIIKIGDLVDSELKTKEVTDGMTEKYLNITSYTSPLPTGAKADCYFEIWETPMVVCGDSYINDMIDKAGGINIFGTVGGTYRDVSNEQIISGDPDVIFITEHSAPWYSQSICDRTGYAGIVNACISDRVEMVNDDLYLRAGPRVIEALENMTRYLYPSLLNW